LKRSGRYILRALGKDRIVSFMAAFNKLKPFGKGNALFTIGVIGPIDIIQGCLEGKTLTEIGVDVAVDVTAATLSFVFGAVVGAFLAGAIAGGVITIAVAAAAAVVAIVAGVLLDYVIEVTGLKQALVDAIQRVGQALERQLPVPAPAGPYTPGASDTGPFWSQKMIDAGKMSPDSQVQRIAREEEERRARQ